MARSGRRPAASLTLDDYRSLVENSPDIMDRFDHDFRHLYVNPAGARVHGVSAEQMIGRTIRETGVPEPFSTLWEARIRKVFKTGKSLVVRDTFPGANSTFYYESHSLASHSPVTNGRLGQ